VCVTTFTPKVQSIGCRDHTPLGRIVGPIPICVLPRVTERNPHEVVPLTREMVYQVFCAVCDNVRPVLHESPDNGKTWLLSRIFSEVWSDK